MAEDQKQDKEKEPKPFEGEEALAKAREGPEAWNEWAEKKENAGRVVNFSKVNFITNKNKNISFEGFTFSGEANFASARFGVAHFEGAIFKGDAKFTSTTFETGTLFSKAIFKTLAEFFQASFNGTTFFNGATFEGTTDFGSTSFNGFTGLRDTTFETTAIFDGAAFDGFVDLDGSRFRIVPDFRGSVFKKHLSLHGIGVDFRRPTEKTDADKYRRLKELAINARDHEREQMFFAYELMAKRGHETRDLALVPNYLYEWTSNFGRSLRRPSAWLIGVWFGFGVLYHQLALKDMSSLWDGLLFSAAQIFPFLGASKGALADAKAALFGDAALDAWVNALGMLEGGLGILFLFLVGLALRNRFRI